MNCQLTRRKGATKFGRWLSFELKKGHRDLGKSWRFCSASEVQLEVCWVCCQGHTQCSLLGGWNVSKVSEIGMSCSFLPRNSGGRRPFATLIHEDKACLFTQPEIRVELLVVLDISCHFLFFIFLSFIELLPKFTETFPVCSPPLPFRPSTVRTRKGWRPPGSHSDLRVRRPRWLWKSLWTGGFGKPTKSPLGPR